jgi:predicted dienelactone hydrolase
MVPAANRAMAAKYDPLAVDANFRTHSLELTVHDAKRNRDIPVRVYLPESVKPAPVVLFSHGLGGSRNGNEFLGQHWAARGYVASLVNSSSDQLRALSLRIAAQRG